MRRYSDSDSPYLPPKNTSKNSTLQSPKKTHPSNINDVSSPQISQEYDPLVQNVIALPESPAKDFKKITNQAIQLSFYTNFLTWTSCSPQLNQTTSLGTSHPTWKILRSL